MKKILLSISGVASLMTALILLAVTGRMGKVLPEQQMAERWSEQKDVAQISCFFELDASVDEEVVQAFRHSLDIALKEASLEPESENPGARMWVDAYSAGGKVTLSNGKTSMDADAIGIGGDFFLFHPLKLLSGAYFSGNDVNSDYCVIDQYAAWQLFGSNDVAGMTVYIGDVPHIITGVVERPVGKMEEKAGLDSSIIYLSYTSLQNAGKGKSIGHYEIVMPNPVSEFAYQHVAEKLGIPEENMEVVENTGRFSLWPMLKVIGEFGTRSMNGKAIIYPYWENMARGYEDMIALLVLLILMLLVYPVILFTVWFVLWWRHKDWTTKTLALIMIEKLRTFKEAGE